VVERKSVGAEVNWGIRFADTANPSVEAELFLKRLAVEVSMRMGNAGVIGRCVTLKMKKRRAGVTDTPKFMGHGICDNMSK
jgi:DNA repair protein REV1